jgi:hypothetical protein
MTNRIKVLLTISYTKYCKLRNDTTFNEMVVFPEDDHCLV